MIDKPTLDAKAPIGNGVAKPEYKDGVTTIISTMTASTSGPTGLNGTYSHENLSAKFKNPNAKHEIHKHAKNQYHDHS